MREREIMALEPDADDPEVGRWLSAMADSRRDTLKELDGPRSPAASMSPTR